MPVQKVLWTWLLAFLKKGLDFGFPLFLFGWLLDGFVELLLFVVIVNFFKTGFLCLALAVLEIVL